MSYICYPQTEVFSINSTIFRPSFVMSSSNFCLGHFWNGSSKAYGRSYRGYFKIGTVHKQNGKSCSTEHGIQHGLGKLKSAAAIYDCPCPPNSACNSKLQIRWIIIKRGKWQNESSVERRNWKTGNHKKKQQNTSRLNRTWRQNSDDLNKKSCI